MDSQTSVDKREKSTVDRSLKAAAASPQSAAMWRSISGLFTSAGHVRDKIRLKHVKINVKRFKTGISEMPEIYVTGVAAPMWGKKP